MNHLQKQPISNLELWEEERKTKPPVTKASKPTQLNFGPPTPNYQFTSSAPAFDDRVVVRGTFNQGDQVAIERMKEDWLKIIAIGLSTGKIEDEEIVTCKPTSNSYSAGSEDSRKVEMKANLSMIVNSRSLVNGMDAFEAIRKKLREIREDIILVMLGSESKECSILRNGKSVYNERSADDVNVKEAVKAIIKEVEAA